jgi:hypothetical protein
MPVSIDHLNEEQLGLLAGRVVLAIGMTPNAVVRVPGAVEGTSWRACYERGMERLARPVNLS